MRKVYLLAAAALILVGIAGWAASDSDARVNAGASAARIDPSELMTRATGLPVEEFDDYSLVFN